MDLKEAISSLIFASPRCADLPELLQIRTVFAAKYGKEFAAAACELRPDCAVNRRVLNPLDLVFCLLLTSAGWFYSAKGYLI
jgi:vacuolar protein sorting-associated protein IST1